MKMMSLPKILLNAQDNSIVNKNIFIYWNLYKYK